MQKRLFTAHVVVVALILVAVWNGYAYADAVLRRIELQAGEQVELACPPGHAMSMMPVNTTSVRVQCGSQSVPTPAAPSATAGVGSAKHPAGCKANEVFQDSQDWWTHDDDELDFGHLHTQLCFPVNAVIDQPYEITVTSLLHDNPGRFYRLMMQSFNGGLDGDDTMCNDRTAVQCKSFNRTLDRCEETDGELIDNGETCRWTDTFTINPAEIGKSGMQQFRFRGFVTEPDGTVMATSTSLHAEIVNGNPPSNLYRDYGTYNYLRGRGWYTDAQYASVYLIDAEQLKKPISGIWRPTVHFAGAPNHDGSPPADVTGHFAAIDTNFHHGNAGTVVLEGSGEYHGELRIDTTKLPNGWHRLFLKADQAMPDGHTNSGVLAVWFQVRN